MGFSAGDQSHPSAIMIRAELRVAGAMAGQLVAALRRDSALLRTVDTYIEAATPTPKERRRLLVGADPRAREILGIVQALDTGTRCHETRL